MTLYTMQAVSGLGFGGPITGSPSGTIYTPTGTGVITNVQLSDVETLQRLGYYVIPSAGASSTTGNAANGGSATISAAAGGASTGGNGNGGNGGDVVLQPGAGGAKNGSGTAGRAGLVIPHKSDGTVGLPTSDPHVAGALWANATIVTVSAG